MALGQSLRASTDRRMRMRPVQTGEASRYCFRLRAATAIGENASKAVRSQDALQVR